MEAEMKNKLIDRIIRGENAGVLLAQADILEIPPEKRTGKKIRELLESDTFRNADVYSNIYDGKGELTAILDRDRLKEADDCMMRGDPLTDVRKNIHFSFLFLNFKKEEK